MNRLSLLIPLALLAPVPACIAPAGSLPSRCQAIEVDPTREIVVTDADVVGDSAFGFARVMGAILGRDADAGARRWVDAWATMPGETTIAAELIATWAAGGTGGLDLERAPFDLIAVANRVDLATLAAGRAGEIRFVYGLVATGTRRPLTVNVEIQLPPTRTPSEWANTWHALGSLTGDDLRSGVESLVGDVLAQTLRGQVRTQDARGAAPVLLEFDINGGASLAPSPLFNQAASDVAPVDLASFVLAHQDQVLADAEELPETMLAMSGEAIPRHLALPGVSPDLTAAFANTTCTGCHTSEPTVDGAFHISPLRRGQDALSGFLVGVNGAPGELSRRAEVLRGLLCQTAAGSSL
jgi:hypothetical protein